MTTNQQEQDLQEQEAQFWEEFDLPPLIPYENVKKLEEAPYPLQPFMAYASEYFHNARYMPTNPQKQELHEQFLKEEFDEFEEEFDLPPLELGRPSGEIAYEAEIVLERT